LLHLHPYRLQQFPNFEPLHVVFTPHEPSVEIFNALTGEGEVFADEEEVRVEADEEDALHVPKEIWQPVPQYAFVLPHQPLTLQISVSIVQECFGCLPATVSKL
tara:strand:+ start:3013 stop:3324 length:312 start_codon:yes stop_codon:yes gene_type:complete